MPYVLPDPASGLNLHLGPTFSFSPLTRCDRTNGPGMDPEDFFQSIFEAWSGCEQGKIELEAPVSSQTRDGTG